MLAYFCHSTYIMKKIGLIGGVTWVSTQEYYRQINQAVNQRLGGFHSANMLINSVDMGETFPFLPIGDWDGLADYITKKVVELKKAGADFFAIGSNTISKVGHQVSKNTGLPYVDIYEATSKAIAAKGLQKVALLGVAFTMKDEVYPNALAKHQIETIIPTNTEMELTHEIIMTELGKAIFTKKSKKTYLDIINRMKKEEAVEGAILGCTEIPLLIKQADTELPVFDTTAIHVKAILDYAFQ